MINRKFLLFTVIIFVFFTNIATARIGETKQQCEKRYGKPISEKDSLVTYIKSGLYIIIEFYNDKADMISFRKTEENILGIAEKLSENEIQTLLEANGEKRVWKKREVISMNKEWQTEDADLFAQYYIMENIFFIATKKILARKSAEKKAAEKNKLNEF